MKIVKKIGIIVSAFMLATGFGVSQAATTTTTASTAPIRVAVVNVQQILQQSPRVAQLSKDLEAQFKPRQTKIGAEQKSLQDSLDKFKKDSPTMTDKARSDTEKKISADRADLVKQVVAYQQDLQKEQNKIMQGILGDLNGIVSAIAKAQSYSLVLDSQAVVFAQDGNDITADVAKQFNDKK
jgi:outer membrane protein